MDIQAGDVIEVVGSTDCGLLEGFVRGTNRSGYFPAQVVQEVNIRQKNITNVSTATPAQQTIYQRSMHLNGNSHMSEPMQTFPSNSDKNDGNDNSQAIQFHYNSLTAPRQKRV